MTPEDIMVFESRLRLGEFGRNGLFVTQINHKESFHLVWDVPHSHYSTVCGDDQQDKWPDHTDLCYRCLRIAYEKIRKICERCKDPF